MEQFHFKISFFWYARLKKFAKVKGVSVSKLIRHIIELGSGLLEKDKLLKYEKGSHWKNIERGKTINTEDKKIIDIYVNIKTPYVYYRKLKNFHDLGNSYSITQVLRYMIEKFFDLVDKKGYNKTVKILIRFNSLWINTSKSKLYKKPHMLFFKNEKPSQKLIITNYFRLLESRLLL